MKALIILLSFTSYILAQEINFNNYFPLAVGNRWEYYYAPPRGLVILEIYKDSVDEDGYLYFFFKRNGHADYYPTYKADTANHLVYWFPFSFNDLWYKLDADSGDSWIVFEEGGGRRVATVIDTYDAFTIGGIRHTKQIRYDDISIHGYIWPRYTDYISYGIGEILYWDEEGGGPEKILTGCIINGDTIGVLTSVDEINYPEYHSNYHLSQNYPNPFNSSTKISFTLPEASKVKLIIYNIIGEIVAELINDNIYEKGTHYINYKPSKETPSGVYFYTIIFNNKSISKKMIYLK